MNGRRRGPRPVRPRRQAVLQRSGRQLCINIIVSAEAVWQLGGQCPLQGAGGQGLQRVCDGLQIGCVGLQIGCVGIRLCCSVGLRRQDLSQ